LVTVRLGLDWELLAAVPERSQVLRAQPQIAIPRHPGLDPVLVPLLVAARLDEELHLHLLELARSEDEVARRDLVAERLADLADAERDLLARRLHHVLEVDEDSLCGLGAQVGKA